MESGEVRTVDLVGPETSSNGQRRASNVDISDTVIRVRVLEHYNAYIYIYMHSIHMHVLYVCIYI